MDYKNGISVKFPGISHWENVPVKSILEEKFGVSVYTEHDPDCLLYSFMEYETDENILLFRIDKSIGMAAAVGGRIIKGQGVLEIAHNTVIPNGKFIIFCVFATPTNLAIKHSSYALLAIIGELLFIIFSIQFFVCIINSILFT